MRQDTNTVRRRFYISRMQQRGEQTGSNTAVTLMSEIVLAHRSCVTSAKKDVVFDVPRYVI